MSTLTNIARLAEIKTIRIYKNEYVKKVITNIFNIIKINNIKIKDLSKELDISYLTFWEYFHKKQSVPYYIILKLSKKFNLNLDYNNIIFETGPRRNFVSLPTLLDEDLAFIIGAHLADGCLKFRSTVWNKNLNARHYELVLREEYESNVKYFTETFNHIFKTEIKYKLRKNHFEFYMSNKTIFYFFNWILDLPFGKKSDIIKVPSYIFNSNNNIKHSFLKGIFMFDGGVNYIDGTFCLVSKSKDLIEGVSVLLDELDLPADSVYLKPDKYLRYRIIIRKIDKLRELMSFFEEKTEKWYRIKEHLYGFDKAKDLYKGKNSQNINDLILKINRFYPKKRKNVLGLAEFIILINKLKEMDLNKISTMLNIKTRLAQNYLSKLERLGILKSGYKNKMRYWSLDSNLNIERR